MAEPIPAFDYRRELSTYREEVDRAIADVLDSGWLILGQELAAFESEFAASLGVKHAVGVASGTDALILSLRALAVGAGDEVITVANTAVPTVSAIVAVGAIPRFVDIDPDTLQMCPIALEKTISNRTRCVIPVHLHGCPADINAINSIAKSMSIPVIGDCAQAFGASIGGSTVGALSDISCYSFYPTKNLGAMGDGGICVTDSDQHARVLRELRQYGFREDRIAHRQGICSRLDELQAAILRIRLKHFLKGHQQRCRIAEKYLASLSSAEVQLPHLSRKHLNGAAHAWHQFVIRSKNRESLGQRLQRQSIGFGIHYPVPIHLMPAYRYLGYEPGSLPETELAANEILSLPIFPGLRDDEIDRVIGAVRES